MYAFNKSNNLYVNYAVTDESEPVDPFFTDNYSNIKKTKHLSTPYPYLFSVNGNESSKIQSKYFLRRSVNTGSNVENLTPDKSQKPFEESYYSCSTNMTGFPFSESSTRQEPPSNNLYQRYDRKVKIRDEPSIY